MAESGTIKFGTSGFRGIIGDNWTKTNIQKLGTALKQMIRETTKNVGSRVSIVVGYDNRFMGRENAKWFCEALACDIIDITMFTMPVPTPVIAFSAVSEFDYGIMFTASHNPFIYNGIKVMLKGGREADDEFFARLSKYLDTKPQFVDTEVKYISDTSSYINKVLSLLDVEKIKKSSLKVLFNSMHGSSAAIVKELLDSLELKYEIMNDQPDPYFAGMVPAPYEYNLAAQCKRVVKEKFNFGFALDGDGDRIAFVDTDGKFYDCNYLLAVFYYYYVEYKKRSGSIVKNLLSSNLTVKLSKKYGHDMYETRVGFKFLGEKLHTTDSLMAGESTGIAFKDISLCKDGIFAAFLLIEAAVNMKKSIGKLIEEIMDLVGFQTFYAEVAYAYDESQREKLEKRIIHGGEADFGINIEKTENLPDGVKYHFMDGYWCAARLSGTEPVVRLYTEMPNEREVLTMIRKLEETYGLTVKQK